MIWIKRIFLAKFLLKVEVGLVDNNKEELETNIKDINIQNINNKYLTIETFNLI